MIHNFDKKVKFKMVSQEEIRKHLRECEKCRSASDKLNIKIHEHMSKSSNKLIYKCDCCDKMQHGNCFTCSYLAGRIRRTIKLHIIWLKFIK